jgi:hypothetical protein
MPLVAAGRVNEKVGYTERVAHVQDLQVLGFFVVRRASGLYRQFL